MRRAKTTPIHKLRFGFIACIATLLSSHGYADDLVQQRKNFEHVYQLAKQGKPWRGNSAIFQQHSLLAWIEHAELMFPAHPETTRIESFVTRHAGTYLASDLRRLLAKRYAESGRWQDLLALDIKRPDIETRCRIAEARIKTKSTENLAIEARELWLSPKSLPPACNVIFSWLKAQKQFDKSLLWKRIELAVQQGNTSFAQQLSNSLSATERMAVTHLSELLNDPIRARRSAKQWPNDAAHRRAISLAVAYIARRDHNLAASLWRELSVRFSFGATAKARMIDAIALYRANSYTTDAADWMALIPEGKDSPMTREWRVREALSRKDFKAVLVAFSRMYDVQKQDPRWRYWHARALDETNQNQAANQAWRVLAQSPSFHGFLAADRLGIAYPLCPTATPTISRSDLLKRHPGLARALELRSMGWIREARREWEHLISALNTEQRRGVVAAVDQHSWFDRAPFALSGVEDQSLYELRFPIAHRALIESAAERNRLDPAYVFGLIRSESAWVEDARSSANAYGLMQLLPATAKRMAALEGQAFTGSHALLDPPTNVRLGTRFLAEMGKRFQNSPWLTAAAYNAGPARVDAWLSARGHLPADIFIETIPFKETREYVSRVLAFTLIYDWRLNKRVLTLSARLPEPGTTMVLSGDKIPRRDVQCPKPG